MLTFNQMLKILKKPVAVKSYLLLATCLIAANAIQASAEEAGVTGTTIQIGGVMDLNGASKGLGLGMKAGIEAALNG